MRHQIKQLFASMVTAVGVLAAGAAGAADLPPAPEPGAGPPRRPHPPSRCRAPRVDAIREAGVLRVGVQNNDPWLAQNTTGQGEPWAGPAWLLAKTLAELMGVEMQEVPTSNETKITLLGANQADMSISALGVNDERLKVVDFIVYSANSTCMVGRRDNPKFAEAETVDDLNKEGIDLVYGIGSPDQGYLEERFPLANVRGVTVHIDEVISGHADSTPYNRIQTARLLKRLPEMIALPKENNCQDSTEQSLPVGMAIDKNQPVFLEWARSVAEAMQDELDAEEARVVETMVQ
jgi:polar amino acid transport system substrate-binding protein